MPAFLLTAFTWLISAVRIKAVFAVILGLVLSWGALHLQMYLNPYTNPNFLYGAFGGQDSGVWYFLNLFNVSYGVPLCVAALISRFLIRRLPFIG